MMSGQFEINDFKLTPIKPGSFEVYQAEKL
mgnify:CR=1 FL=1